MARNIHEEPFDDETKVKLKLYQDYLGKWLPVFIKIKKPVTINIFDFFSGPGEDLEKSPGSPLIAAEEIKKWRTDIKTKGLKVNLYLNEYDFSKYEYLKSLFEESQVTEKIFEVHFFNMDFIDVLRKLYRTMNKPETANLLFLDQNGIKQITERVFKGLLGLPKTDFLFFISSSYIFRFGSQPEFRRALPIPIELIREEKYYRCHQAVFDYYQSLVPKDIEAFLGQFTIMKNSNIYGLIFACKHPLGIHKFITCCWKEDPLRGEANFDIAGENFNPDQGDLFDPDPKPNKIKIFEKDLETAILEKTCSTSLDVFCFALQRGFIPSKHAKPVLLKLKTEEIIVDVVPLGRDSYKEIIPIKYV